MCDREVLIRPMQKVATNKRIQAAQHMDGVDAFSELKLLRGRYSSLSLCCTRIGHENSTIYELLFVHEISKIRNIEINICADGCR